MLDFQAEYVQLTAKNRAIIQQLIIAAAFIRAAPCETLVFNSAA